MGFVFKTLLGLAAVTLVSNSVEAQSAAGGAIEVKASTLSLVQSSFYIMDVSAVTQSQGCFPSNEQVGESNTGDIRNYLFAEYQSGLIQPGETLEISAHVCTDRADGKFGNKFSVGIAVDSASVLNKFESMFRIEAVMPDGQIAQLDPRPQAGLHTREAGTYKIKVTYLGRKAVKLRQLSILYSSYKNMN